MLCKKYIIEYKNKLSLKVWTVSGLCTEAVPRMESAQVRRYPAAFNQLDVRQANL